MYPQEAKMLKSPNWDAAKRRFRETV
jgi:hypothetical protein